MLERILGCGTLVVESAGERGQLVLRDVPHVEEVQRDVYRLAEADEERRHGGGARRTTGGGDRPRRPESRPARSRRGCWAANVATGSDEVAAKAGWRSTRWAPAVAGRGVPRRRRRAGRVHRLRPRGDRRLQHLVEAGVLDDELAVGVTRAIGHNTARLAEWQFDALVEHLIEQGRSREEANRVAATQSAEHLEDFEALLVLVWRRQLAR